jgi:hypothetical protein
MVFLNNSLLIHTSLSALMVIGGVVVKNSGNKLGLSEHKVVKPLGMGLFVGGWLYCAYALSAGRADKIMPIVASLAVVGSVMGMKRCMDKGKTPAPIYPIIFAIAWLAIGYGVGNHMRGMMQYAGLLASALVLGSMMVALPYERKHCLVDGPGMPMFVVAWAIIAVMNSSR